MPLPYHVHRTGPFISCAWLLHRPKRFAIAAHGGQPALLETRLIVDAK